MARKNGRGSTAAGKAASTIWGGRFAAGPDALMTAINASIHFDRRLYEQDIAGSLAHADMLAKIGVLTRADAAAIRKGLAQVRAEIAAGKLKINPALEDIHMHVETRLKEIIGEPGGRLHTARSRNDQVAVDFRLWVREAVDRLDAQVKALQGALLDQADKHAATVMPGFTHLQAAQPVTLGHHLMAYVEMFGRDRSRLQDARRRMNESPLGAAALAGTGFPIDRYMTAKALGFAAPMANSLDAVSDRDFALDYLSATAILAVHLSRFAEELVLWTSAQFAFIRLSDRFTTGSSIMPQKKNPDAAELVRGKTGRIVGALNALLIVMKGLPLAYGKDMQEDKEPLFDACDAIEVCVAATAGMVVDMEPDVARLRAAAGVGFTTATDLADWLVRELNLPFRTAHHVTGTLVKVAEQRGIGLEDLPLADMQAVEKRITRDVYRVLGVDNSVKSRTSYGGTAPREVKKQAVRWRRALAKETKR